MAKTDWTEYSDMIDGEAGNYGWKTRYDISGTGYLGISQFENGESKERVLLSPKQVRELAKFIKPQS